MYKTITQGASDKGSRRRGTWRGRQGAGGTLNAAQNREVKGTPTRFDIGNGNRTLLA